VKAMIDMRDQIANIKFNKLLETHLELQNNNYYDAIEDEFDEPEHLKENEESKEREESEKENESQHKEISTESMEKVTQYIDLVRN
jgi:glutamine synthetase adenylyltransferase